MICAVLFDLDGVLLNSMPYHVRAWQEIFSRYNVRVEADQIYFREGTRSFELARILAESHGLNFTEEQLTAITSAKSQRYNEITKAGLMDGAADLVSSLKQAGLKLAIVTGTLRENLLQVMPPDLVSRFDTIVSGDSVKRGKPHPEPYLTAARQLNCDPAACVVVENAQLGVEAAKAAGMKCIAVTTTQTAEKLRQADWILPDLAGVRKHLEKLIAQNGPDRS